MKRAVVVTVASVLAGCATPAPPSAPTPPTDPPPAAMKKEKPRVVVTAGKAGADPTGAGDVDVTLDVPEGFHINSNAPLDPTLIATSLALDDTDVKDVKVEWPAAKLIPSGSPSPSPDKLAVFDGRVTAHVTFTMKVTHPNAPLRAHVVVGGEVRYQMCNESTCYPPATAPFKAE